MDRLTAALPTAMDSRESLPGTQTQRDAEILKSLPGVGRIVLATLLAEAHDPLRRRDYQALRCLSGVAPVTKRSGKSLIVIRRLAAHNRLQDAVYHWASVAQQHDPVSKAKYTALRSRGHGHARALRGVADRLLSVACAMLVNQTLFDRDRQPQNHAAQSKPQNTRHFFNGGYKDPPSLTLQMVGSPSQTIMKATPKACISQAPRLFCSDAAAIPRTTTTGCPRSTPKPPGRRAPQQTPEQHSPTEF